MVGKTSWALCAAVLLQLHTAAGLAMPVLPNVELPVKNPLLRRDNATVEPPADPTPIITEIEQMTKEELQDLIDSFKSGLKDIVSRDPTPSYNVKAPAAVAPRAQASEGALLTFLDGDMLPGTDSRCTDFDLRGPFTTFQAYMGSSNFRAVSATSISGNSSEVRAGDTLVDAGLYEFKQNERITKFSVGRVSPAKSPCAISFETDLGNTYKAESEIVASNTVEYEDLDVGSGVLARIRGASCSDSALGIIGSIGFDFIDVIDSVGISNIDYEGFTNSIMPAGLGTQLSVGSQILDNRNSSEKQTITLTTTDAITRQSTVSTDTWVLAGGTVGIETSAGIPLIGESKVSTSATWSVQSNTVSFYPCRPKTLSPADFITNRVR